MNILLACVMFLTAYKLAQGWFNTMRNPWTEDDVWLLVGIILFAALGLVVLVIPIHLGGTQ